MTFATLLDYLMECANEFCQMISAWSTMLMSSDQNEYCIALCTELKEQAENNSNLISNIIINDLSWVLGYDPEMKQQSSQWKT
jgi:hypothetical protein